MEKPIVISTAPFDGYDFATAFKEIANLGVDYVEIAFIEGYTDPFTEAYFVPDNARMILSLLADNGLDCLSFSSHIDLAKDDAVDIFTRRMDFAKHIGARYIISNAGPTARKAQFMQNIAELGRRAADRGMIIALENPGDGRPNVLDSAGPAAAILAEIDLDSVCLNYDFGNLISHCFEKIDPVEDYRLALDCTGHFHIKDVAAGPDGWYFTEIGQGGIDYRRILTEIAALETPIPISLEIPLRVSRRPDALPRRAAQPVDLDTIRTILSGSVQFVKNMISQNR